MSNQLHTINLKGCSPTPLAHYLKALGILRLVAEQVDTTALCWWKNDSFWLRSTLNETALQEFFLNQYSPTPLVAPWNGGSGFNPKDNQDAMKAIEGGEAARFCSYRDVLAQCKSLLTNMPEDEEKANLLLLCRNTLPDNVLTWLDAAFVLTGAGPKYPPLLGTGGNDGRLEFTNNFMQHLISLLNPTDGNAAVDAEARIEESLFAELSCCRSRGTIGQYDPGSLGGSNSGSGFDGYSTVNSWDYVLMLEGAIMFAAASTKRLESGDSGALAYPFCVRSTGVGYRSSSDTDEASSRAEMWLPIWESPASFAAITTLLSEGRVETRKRKAKNGVDFARAIASLGVDRGINEFQRYGFQQRNGLAYLAVPLARFQVKAQPEAEELLAPLDHWLDRFRRAATGKTAPARAGRALRQLESSILNLCQRGDATDVQATLIALGEAEASVAISKQLRDGSMGSGISPLPLLSDDWLIKSYDCSCEFRLAAALASVTHSSVGPIRRHFEPIDPTTWRSRYPKWARDASDPAIVWTSGSLTQNLSAILNRRMIDVMKSGKDDASKELLAPLRGRLVATLPDIAAFIGGAVNDERIESLFKAFCLMDFPQSKEGFAKVMQTLHAPQVGRAMPDAAYGLLKLCYLPHRLNDVAIVLNPQILRRATLGDGAEATRLASRRLTASGFGPAADALPMSRQQAQRTAAALLFPISKKDADRLSHRVLHQSEPNVDTSVAHPG
ncbi:type I-G CRISPR-associated protein Cas8g1/Csx17 [Allorhodopirellula heiligendammensis]|uniref:Type I-U CRISPR-associated protein Csx17 n=1 Tax=Allorhodopirellula heiligendammensis TaxID=2714739 RepID=A0A5C6C2S6_9BACT|nr:type I-U CRISPR-associated protein Csx17 [Allorhodopirellula heiligendammensis]TWU17961.1 hypothetical protein Poly21_01130 [Allorhodopirellula heiligendammensis]